MLTRSIAICLGLALGVVPGAVAASVDDYPSGNIRFIVNVAAGGVTDAAAGQEGLVDLADEIERLLGLGVRVDAVDLAPLLQRLAQPLRASRDDGELGRGRAARL